MGALNVYPHPEPQFTHFASRRSVVHSTKGIVSCTQPLATAAGIDILRKGGNAADAAVAVAAAINVTEPGSTGIGGDMFCLYYDAKTKTVSAMNGSGRSGQNVTLEKIRKDLKILEGQTGKIPMNSVHAVTVPGAAAGWVDCVERFGSGKSCQLLFGRPVKGTLKKHRPMATRCLRRIHLPRVAAEHPKLAKL